MSTSKQVLRPSVGSCVIVLALLLCAGCARTSNDKLFTVSTPGVDLFASVPKSSKPEAKYGYAVYLEVLSDNTIIASDRVNTLVQTVGSSLQRFVERTYFPYTFTVIADERIYATSTPGGFVYVSKGMVDFCGGKDRLAAVIAHELAQIQYRRMRYTLKKRLANLAESVSGYSGFVLGPAGTFVPKGMRLVNSVLLQESSRMKRTLSADRLAVEYLRAAGYETRALYDVVEAVATSDGSEYHRIEAYLRLRPTNGERIRQLREITALPDETREE